MRIVETNRPTPAATPEALMADTDLELTGTDVILDAPRVAAAKVRFGTNPHVRPSVIAFQFTPLIGMPAVARVQEQGGTSLPGWWLAGAA